MSGLPKPRAKGEARLSMYEQNRLDESARLQAQATQAATQPSPEPSPRADVASILGDEPTGRLSVAPITQATLHSFEDLFIAWRRAQKGLNRYAIVQAILDEFIADPELQARVARRMRR